MQFWILVQFIHTWSTIDVAKNSTVYCNYGKSTGPPYLVDNGQLVSYTTQGHVQPLHHALHAEMCHFSIQENLWVCRGNHNTLYSNIMKLWQHHPKQDTFFLKFLAIAVTIKMPLPFLYQGRPLVESKWTSKISLLVVSYIRLTVHPASSFESKTVM